MSQSERPRTVQPPLTNDNQQRMAQIERPSGLQTSEYFRRPEQTSSGLQLPPIQSIPPARSVYDGASHTVQLPPMQVPHYEGQSMSRATTTRSIPVSHLLSSDPPSPPKPPPTGLTQHTLHSHIQTSHHGDSPNEYRAKPLSYHRALPHRLDQAPVAYPRAPPPPHYQASQYTQVQQPARAQYHPRSDANEQRPFSPATSVLSSPSYTHSEPSPRSSIGTSSLTSVRSRKGQAPPFDFKLSIRQQPVAARACGFGERDRRVIDPPPILELKITNRISGAPEADPDAMLALNCQLLSPDGHDDETELPPAHPDMPSTRRLMGTLVASPNQLKDEHGIAGTFFVFPDLSCRSPGKYRLRFKLIRVDPTSNTIGAISPCVANVVTDVFSVYTAKDFPGMRASSTLLKSLRRQGLNVSVKKGSEARKGKGKSKRTDGSASSTDEGDDSDGASSGDMGCMSKEKKKSKRRRQDWRAADGDRGGSDKFSSYGKAGATN